MRRKPSRGGKRAVAPLWRDGRCRALGARDNAHVGIVGWAIGVAADAIYGVLARIGVENFPSLTQGLYQLDGYLTVKAFWFAAAFALATAIAAWRTLPQWYAWVSPPRGGVLRSGGVSVRHNGFFAPLGGMTGISFIALLVWTLATSFVIWRLAPAPERQAAAAVPAS